MNLEEVFWKLQQQRDKGDGSGGTDGNDGGQGQGKILDNHDWEDIQKAIYQLKQV